jgi:hypothetical protein
MARSKGSSGVRIARGVPKSLFSGRIKMKGVKKIKTWKIRVFRKVLLSGRIKMKAGVKNNLRGGDGGN